MGTDTAFLDRIHCYLPEWEVPKFRPEHFTDDYGFITDYLAGWIREMRKEQLGDALDHYFHLGKNLNQRDVIAVRRMVDVYLKLMYPNGEFTKDDVEEVLKISLEMRRRVKEQLKKLGLARGRRWAAIHGHPPAGFQRPSPSAHRWVMPPGQKRPRTQRA